MDPLHDPHASVIITVGLNTTGSNTAGVDSDIIVGLSNGTMQQQYVDNS